MSDTLPRLDPSIGPDPSVHESPALVTRCPYCNPKPPRVKSEFETALEQVVRTSGGYAAATIQSRAGEMIHVQYAAAQQQATNANEQEHNRSSLAGIGGILRYLYRR